ncbi:pyridoxal phosphate-dependent aminotransferase [Phytohabitans suffuscus]|uniref:Aminotransferase n=1 Tax=Phytohabitans suffuscus TaxID=624315 RepID=A0A6F8YTY5_9ACTN|nr:aminotransferase class I/II-fold pyridoxal phosphate-dependent enzyme [Phytohabitans suffuscus]BCB89610.1 aminotransferase [Phytohabitans suffuscus]
MPELSATALRVPASGIREIVNLALSRGGDVVRLEIGEPHRPPAPHIAEAGAAAARAGTGYTQSAGIPQLRAELAEDLRRRYEVAVSPDRVIVSQGAVQGIAAVLAAVLRPGDEVLVPDPSWPNYEMQTLLFGGVPMRYPLRPDNGFVPDPAEVAALVGPRTRVLVLNSPGNPTGAVTGRPALHRLVEIAARHDVLVISDEVYDEVLFEGEPAALCQLGAPHVVSVFSFSKTYAMTGWRVGYVLAPPWLAPTLARLQEPFLSCISGVSQAAALAALSGPRDGVATAVAEYRRNRDVAVRLLADAGIHPVVPDGAFYLMVPLAPGVDSRRAALDLVGHGVATAPGTAFGDVARAFLRISFAATEAQLVAGLDRLIAWHDKSGGGAVATEGVGR